MPLEMMDFILNYNDYFPFVQNSHIIKSYSIKDDPLFYDLLYKSYQLLNDNGFICSPKFNSNYLIEFHTINLEDKKVKNQLATHQDDYGGVPFRVNTIIYYIEKPEEVIGGNLIIYESEYSKKNCIELAIKKNMYLMIKGNVWHEITPCYGKGSRKCIVVQILRDD